MSPLLMPTVADLESERRDLLNRTVLAEATLRANGARFRLGADDARIFRRLVEIDYLLGE